MALQSLLRNPSTVGAMRRRCPPGTRISTVRRSRLHGTPATRYAYKDDQDKDSLKPRSIEYGRSGSDNAAAQSDAAFDPEKTSPESQMGKGDENLEMSPGNKESSKQRHPEEGGAQKAPGESAEGRDRTSGKGSPNKAGGAKTG